MSGERSGSTRNLVVFVVLLSLVALGPAVASSLWSDQPSSEGEVTFEDARAEGRAHTVAPHPNSTTAIWPYTSSRKSVDSATLPINIVVLADVDLVRSMLILRPDATWEDQRQGLNGTRDLNGTDGTPDPDGNESLDDELDLNESDSQQGDAEPRLVPTSANATGVYWSDASGSNRYTYIRSGDPGSGQWIEETDQLHDGDYFGTRYHIRFYEVPDGENTWTALQAHREHFDWFRLRHTVGNLPSAQFYVENQFYDQWYVKDLHKARFTGGGVLNSDGWATVVGIRYPEVLRQSLGALALVSGVAVVGVFGGWASSADRRRIWELREALPIGSRHVILALSVAAIPLFVRIGSLAVERAEVVNSPRIVAGAFYPILAFGPPIVVYVLARGIAADEAFVAAFAGLGVGFLADYTYLGIEVLPIELIVHRAFMLVAVGFVAVAGTDRPHDPALESRSLLVGGWLWIVGLLWALFLW